jgi:hypothetical protein
LNYIKQIKFFWKQAKRHSLGDGEIAMYFYLLECSNVHDWENPVMEPNATLQSAIRVKSFNTLKEIRNRLQQAGLIKFKSKNGSATVEYDIFNAETLTFSKFDKVVDEVTDEVAAKVPDKVVDEVRQKHYVLLKPKPKPKDEIQIQHGLFFERLFSEAADYDREQILIQVRGEAEIKRNWVEIFNAHLATEDVPHDKYGEWLKHFRSWLIKKLPDLKKGDAIQHQTHVTKKFLN